MTLPLSQPALRIVQMHSKIYCWHHACFEYETVTFPLLFIATDFHELGNGGWVFCWVTAIIIMGAIIIITTIIMGAIIIITAIIMGAIIIMGTLISITTIIMGAIIIITSPIPILSSPCSPVVSGIRVPAAEGIVHSLHTAHSLTALF